MQLCTRDFCPQHLNLGSIIWAWELDGWARELLIGPGVPSPGPHIGVLSLSEQVLVKEDFFSLGAQGERGGKGIWRIG